MNLPNPDCEVDCLDVLWKQLVRNFAWSKQVRNFMKCHGVPIYAWSKKVRNSGKCHGVPMYAWSKQVRIFKKCHGVPIYAWSKKVRNLGSVTFLHEGVLTDGQDTQRHLLCDTETGVLHCSVTVFPPLREFNCFHIFASSNVHRQ